MVHLVVAVLVVIVVNAQLTWWIVFVLRENRTRLALERGAVESLCRIEADRIEQSVTAMHQLFETAVNAAFDRAPDLPAPLTTWWLEDDSGTACGTARLEGGALALSTSSPSSPSCLWAVTSSGWTVNLLQIDPVLEIAPPPEDDEAGTRPAVSLTPPFDDRSIRPRQEIWDSILEGYRGRILMMVCEGSFFALLLFVLVALLWRTLRREVALEQQHRNFLSAITHELKSPLAAMRLSLETVLRGRADSSASVRFLENALQDTERLQSLVQKVLEVTRYAGTDAGVRLHRCCLSEIVDEALGAFSRRTTAAGAVLASDIEPEIWALADEEAFAIVISNLLENALKYGGTIPRVDVRLALAEDTAVLDITDNGRGIATDDIPFVFDRFWRSGDEMTRTTQGTGLGLFLVKQIVTGHHGTVTVLQTGPKGTTFQVTLPDALLVEE